MIEEYSWKNVPSDKKRIKLRLSNICNLKCRICGPEYSNRFLGYREMLRDYDIDFDELEYLELSGGDPFQDKRTEKFLSKIKPHTQVLIHTNGCKYPNYLNPDWNISVTCNGVKDVAEFVAWDGFDWDTYLDNLKKWKTHKVSWKTNISLLNVLDFDNIKKLNLEPHEIEYQQGFLDIATLHPNVKKLIKGFDEYKNSKKWNPQYTQELITNINKIEGKKIPSSNNAIFKEILKWKTSI